MRFPVLRRTAAALAAACVLPLTAAPAAADSPPAAFLTLIAQPLEDPAGGYRFLTLECGPADAGTHPSPEDACASLRAVDGDFAALPHRPGPTPCPPVYWPVRGTAVGHWNGSGVYYSDVFGDLCSASNATDGVIPEWFG